MAEDIPADDVTPSDHAEPASSGRHRSGGNRRATRPPKQRRQATGIRALVLKFEMPLLILVAIAIAVLLKTFVVQPFYIPSESMEKTLHGCTGCGGDRILVFKPIYDIRDPHPGDIIVFKAPPDWEGAGAPTATNPLTRAVQWFGQLVGVIPPSERDLVKRVIAIGGQTVKCCDAKGNVQISENGDKGPWTSLNEPYIYEPQSFSPPKDGQPSQIDGRSFGPVTIPKGRLWVLGDHRSDSADSRYHCGDGGTGSTCDAVSSTVPVNSVIGKAVVIAWPPSRWRTLGTPATFKTLGLAGEGFATEPATAAVVGVGVLGAARLWRRKRR